MELLRPVRKSLHKDESLVYSLSIVIAFCWDNLLDIVFWQEGKKNVLFSRFKEGNTGSGY